MMLTRRTFLFCATATLAATPVAAIAQDFSLDPEYEPQGVRFPGYPPGTVVVDPGNFFLYYVMPNETAIRYGVGVGEAGLGFTGTAIVGRKAEWPRWRPSANMIKRNPEKFAGLARGIRGGPNSPLGARALYLYRDGEDTRYRIHGTNEPESIGNAASNGCIRMINDHVIDLYGRVKVGAPVVVLPVS